MSGPFSKVVWTITLVVCAVLPISSQSGASTAARQLGPLTCDADALHPDSYALATRVQALIVNEDRSDWWDRFIIGKHAADLKDLNSSAITAAERALELDPRNLLAHAILARQYVVVGEDASRADASWRTVLDNGGAVVWTATLYDVDTQSYFLVAFDRNGLRIYRYGELAGAFETSMGMPKFVGVDRERFWRAMAGCIDPSARPESSVAWNGSRNQGWQLGALVQADRPPCLDHLGPRQEERPS
jgi:hypothetical protein